MFDRLKKLATAFKETSQKLVGSIQQVVGLRPKLDARTIDDLEEVLLSADVGPAATERILGDLRERARVEVIDGSDAVMAAIQREMCDVLVGASGPRAEMMPSEGPRVILVVGVNGSGKTTTCGKLAQYFKERGQTVVLGAGDTFRAAAIEQLAEWASRAGVDVVKGAPGGDPSAVAYDTVAAAIARNARVALIDTAGRLHTKANLLEELKKTARVVAKKLPGAPHETWLVLDATIGQNAIVQARTFHQSVPLTGLILTKLDGTAKGGAVFAIAHELGLPIRYIGTGESLGDLEVFDGADFVASLFDAPASAD